MADNINQQAAEQAAAAVDPNSGAQAAIMGRITGKSHADTLNQQTHASARQVPGMDMEGEFANRFEKALEAKTQADPANIAPVPDPAPAPAPPNPLDPPKIGKHGHIRQLKEGIAAKAQTWDQEKAQLTRQIEELKQAKPEPTPQLNEILQENQRLSRELAVLDITRSPNFQSKFEQPRKVTIQQAKNIAGEKAGEVEAILSMPAGILRDQKLDELVSELPPSTASIVRAANNKLAEIDFNRQIEIETAKLGLEDHIKQQERAQLVQKQQQDQEFNELLSGWSREVDALNPDKNRDAQNIIGNARKMFEGGLGTKERAAAALQAAILPVLVQEHSKALQEVERLQTALARYEDGVPGGTTNVEDNHDPRIPTSPADRLASFERGLEEKMRRDPTFSQQRRGRVY